MAFWQAPGRDTAQSERAAWRRAKAYRDQPRRVDYSRGRQAGMIPCTNSYVPGFPNGEVPPFMEPEGSGANGVCAMAEALGENEERDGLPLRPYAEAGSIFERAVRMIPGCDRQQFTLTNAVWYRPPNNWLTGAPWEYEAVNYCRPFNEKLFRERQPKCFLALGGVAMRELSGMEGHRQNILLTRGFPVPSRYGVPVVGTYHPVYLRRGEKGESKESGTRVEGAAGQGMDLLGVLIRDIQLAIAIGKNGWRFESEREVQYIEHGTIADLNNFYQAALLHPELPISWDIETRDTIQAAEDESQTIVSEYSEIYQIQFSL